MSEQTSTLLTQEASEPAVSPIPTTPPEATSPWDDPAKMAEMALYGALSSVLDPELEISVVDLGLIREVIIGAESAEVKMVLTTVFCPYGPTLLAQVQQTAQEALGLPVKVTLLAEAWNPADAGLIW